MGRSLHRHALQHPRKVAQAQLIFTDWGKPQVAIQVKEALTGSPGPETIHPQQVQARCREEVPVPQQAWNEKRERQYEHIKSSQQDEGRPEDRAEEIAARTVNKERARSGESDQKSRSSTHDISASRRGGKRSGSGPGGRTKQQLYEEAKRSGISGRSKMTKAELEQAVGR
jgi:hypothetical protein